MSKLSLEYGLLLSGNMCTPEITALEGPNSQFHVMNHKLESLNYRILRIILRVPLM